MTGSSEEIVERGRMALSEFGRPDLASRLAVDPVYGGVVNGGPQLTEDDRSAIYRAAVLVGAVLAERCCEDCYVAGGVTLQLPRCLHRPAEVAS